MDTTRLTTYRAFRQRDSTRVADEGDRVVLIYYVPWGNIGFYYNTAGIGYSDETIHLGTYVASFDDLEQLEGRDVTVEVVR